MPMITVGFEGEMERMARLAEKTDGLCEKAVRAGAKVLVERLKEKAPYRDGDLQKSIKAKPPKYSYGGGYECEVLPEGNDPKTGEPLGKIGNILEYGRSYGRTKKGPMPWFYSTVEESAGEVSDAMRGEFEKGMGTP